MELQLFKAIVEDIDDPDRQGKIKIRVLPEMEKIEDDTLPWAIPFICECSSNSLKNNLPEKGSTIRVLIDKYWKRFYYLSNPYFYGLFDYSKIENSLKAVKEGSLDTTYSNLKFTLYEDGGLNFHNSLDGSHGFIHKSGSYIVFDKEGEITVESMGHITLSNEISTLGGLLEELINDLSTLTTEGTAVSQTSPTLTAQMSVLLPKVKALLK